MVTVQTGKLQRATLHGYVEGFGSVAPAPAQADRPPAVTFLAPAIAGIIAQINIGVGQVVTNGEVVFQLDSHVADVAVEFARKTLDRQKKLLESNNTSQKSVQDAEQQLASALAQQALYRVKSPLSGTVTQVHASPGQAVDLTTVLAEITDLARLVVVASIPSTEASGVAVGQPVELLTDPPLSSSVSFISPTVDATNNTVLVLAPSPDKGGLRPGQFVQLRIVTAEHTNCLAAPAQSVVSGTNDQEVIAVVSGDEATQVPVKTGLREKSLVEVEGAGLKEGDTVVTLGAYGLPKKTKVHIVNP